jgi:hypothetical protein
MDIVSAARALLAQAGEVIDTDVLGRTLGVKNIRVSKQWHDRISAMA